MVVDLRPGTEGRIRPASFNGVLLCSADDGVQGEELWRSDGTVAGTHRVADINPGPDGSSPVSLYAFDGGLWFAADDGVHGRELRTDGLPARRSSRTSPRVPRLESSTSWSQTESLRGARRRRTLWRSDEAAPPRS
jgi:ELWxxDGT repeat protein